MMRPVGTLGAWAATASLALLLGACEPQAATDTADAESAPPAEAEGAAPSDTAPADTAPADVADVEATPAPTSPPNGLHIDLRYETLDNGLKVVMARDDTVPTVTVSLFVDVGFRTEPRDRSGFSHLFEHILFEETENLENGEFDRIIEGAGGINNGYTTLDQTGFWEVVPTHLLETMLWIEADRLARLSVTEELVRNQSAVVQNELKVRTVNQPYGGFAWLTDWIQAVAFENEFNHRDIDDELADVDAATGQWALDFYETYYRPNNVVLVIAGDFEYDETSAWVHRYFDDIPSGPEVTHPDFSEPEQTAQKVATREDAQAPRPAYVVGYHTPPRNSPERLAIAFLDQILAQGDDSRLHQALVVENGFASGVYGLIGWGDIYDQLGPTLLTFAFIHDDDVEADAITAVIDEALQPVLDAPLSQEEVDRARTKLRSILYDIADSSTRSGLSSQLGVFALYDDDPGRINRLEAELASVTPELIHATAQAYLRPSNRTILIVEPAPADDEANDDDDDDDNEAAEEDDQ